MGIKYQPLITDSLAKQISESIREAIMEGALKVDERLPNEQELAARFGVSRPTVREALKRLAAQNLIRSRRGPAGGTFVNRPSYEELSSALTTASTLMVSLGGVSLSEVAEVRHELELICGRLAAERRDDSHLVAMAAELEIQSDPELSNADFCASDVRFHRTLVDATQNPMLRFIMFAVVEALQPAANMVVFRFQERRRIVRHHRAIHKAIRERDAEAAAKAMTEQMTYLSDRYLKAQESWHRRHAE